jgi:hypothetical protein
VRESRTPGSVRGVLSNGHPYRVNRCIAGCQIAKALPSSPAYRAALSASLDRMRHSSRRVEVSYTTWLDSW